MFLNKELIPDQSQGIEMLRLNQQLEAPMFLNKELIPDQSQGIEIVFISDDHAEIEPTFHISLNIIHLGTF